MRLVSHRVGNRLDRGRWRGVDGVFQIMRLLDGVPAGVAALAVMGDAFTIPGRGGAVAT
jgi:hypothetical protein